MPHGIEPILDEDALLNTLRSGHLTPDQFSHLLGMLLLACYDHKVVRSFMADMIVRCNNIQRVLASLDEAVCIELARRANPALQKPPKTAAKARKKTPALAPVTNPDVITSDEIVGIMAAFKHMRAELTDKFEQLLSCATAADTIS